MPFTIYAFKEDQAIQTLRLDQRSAADKGRALLRRGWEVHLTDQSGRRYQFDANQRLELSEPVLAIVIHPE